MAKNSSITSASAVLQLSAGVLYPSPQLLQQFSADRAFSTESADIAEAYKGVDGFLSVGWIPRICSSSYVFAANSPSLVIFDNIVLSEDAVRDKIPLAMVMAIKSIGKKFTFNNGYLMGYMPHPEGAKVLQPQTVKIIWDTVVAGPL